MTPPCAMKWSALIKRHAPYVFKGRRKKEEKVRGAVASPAAGICSLVAYT